MLNLMLFQATYPTVCGPRTIPGVGDIQLFSKDKMLCVPFFCHFLSPSTGSKKIIQYGGLAGGISIHSAAASTYVQCSTLIVHAFVEIYIYISFICFFTVLSPLLIYRLVVDVLSPSTCLYRSLSLNSPISLLTFTVSLIIRIFSYQNFPSLILSLLPSTLFSFSSSLSSLSAFSSLCSTNAVVTAP
jgi:hypothetical protein